MKVKDRPSTELVSRYFDLLAPNYDTKAANRTAYLNSIDSLIISHLISCNSKHPAVLDVGTGTGSRLERIKLQYPIGQFHGCDISPQMVEIAKTKDIDSITSANMSDLPYESESFNYLFCLFNAYGYLPKYADRQNAIDEFFRVLKPGGTAIVDVLNRWHTGEGLSFQKSRLQIAGELAKSALSISLQYGDVMFTADSSEPNRKGFFHSFTDREFRRLAGGAGFSIKDFFVVGYDSGRLHSKKSAGNLLYILERPA